MTVLLKSVCVLHILAAVWAGARSLNYECYPNITVIVESPDMYKYVTVTTDSADGISCSTTSKLRSDASLQITGYDLDQTNVANNSYHTSDDESIYGGDSLSVPPASEAPISPNITVSSSLREVNQTTPSVTTANVGDELYWTIDAPEQYTAMPTSCTVYAGTDTTSPTNKLIIIDGCTEDADVVLSFAPKQKLPDPAAPNITRYWTKLFAFKFFSTDQILVSCQVKLCPPGSTACGFTCGSERKRGAVTAEGEAGVRYGHTAVTLRMVSTERHYTQAPSATSFHAVFWILCAAGLLFYIWS